MEVPGELAYRHVVLRAVEAVCRIAMARACGEDAPAEGFTNQVVSAVGEGFNNIVLHCYRNRTADVVRLHMKIHADGLQSTLEDFGASFDPANASVPDLDAMPESGLGVFIMRSLMDEVNYRAGWPNVLIMSKRIHECSDVLPRLSGRRAANGLLHK
jgi:serine/threonine-protein kinase RsbW